MRSKIMKQFPVYFEGEKIGEAGQTESVIDLIRARSPGAYEKGVRTFLARGEMAHRMGYPEGVWLVEEAESLSYNEQKDAFISRCYDDGEEVHTREFPAQWVESDGRPIKVYPIGALGWGWSATKDPGIPALARQYADLVLDKHRAKEINAVAAYTAMVETSGFPNRKGGESDEDFIHRSALLDFDREWTEGAVFRKLIDQVLAG